MSKIKNEVCSVALCPTKTKLGRKYCSKHYQRLFHNGDPLISKLNRDHDGTCTLSIGIKCTRKYFASGLCKYHFYKTPLQFLKNIYRGMRYRVQGKNSLHLKTDPWAGKEILPEKEFLEWSVHKSKFQKIFYEWVISGFSAKSGPSIDRIDGGKGYTVNNMQWLSHSAHSTKTNNERWAKNE